MRDQPFHHGNLRAVLLDRAEEMLQQRGVEGLSLRELARQAGVSHGAPRSHFVDRRALQDALAERGFTRLGDDIIRAIEGEQQDFARCLRAVGTAYVRFAVTDAALLELMFAAKNTDPSAGVLCAAERLFTAFGALIDPAIASGRMQSADSYRTKLLLAATLQGIASLVVSRRITSAQGNDLVADVTRLLTVEQGLT